MLLCVVCLFKNMSYKWTKMKKLVMYIYLAYFNIMKGVNMKKIISKIVFWQQYWLWL